MSEDRVYLVRPQKRAFLSEEEMRTLAPREKRVLTIEEDERVLEVGPS